MTEGITRAEQNLLLLQSMLPVGEKLYIWCYAPDGRLIASSYPEGQQGALDKAFSALGGKQKALALAADKDERVPRLIGSGVGMQWGVTFEAERKRDLIFVIGPVFYTLPEVGALRAALYAEANGRGQTDWIRAMCADVSALPVMSYAVFSRYVMMVHNTLTGEQLGLEALQGTVPEAPGQTAATAGRRDRMRVYRAEQALLDMVRRGDINYQGALQNSVAVSPGVPVAGKDPLRQMKTSVTVFTTLVTRAAMEGGLSPEVAYPLGDSYIQTAENCRDSGELSSLAGAMYRDFICRVHYAKTNKGYSFAVQKCCDYIELSLDKRVRVSDLAALVGYTEYYLTEKFRKETGKTLTVYIRDSKIARAKVLLDATDLTVAEISDRLAFSAPNYFIRCFKDAAGCTPAKYRKRQKKADGQK